MSLEGRIAVIGWGSLIWDLDDLAPKVEGPWLMRAGPELPFEFSRISPKRRMGLVVCIDPEDGAPCPTHAIRSIRADIHAAAEDLRARERAKRPEQIGACCLASGFRRARLPDVAEAVVDWCAAVGAAGAVWTDLDANFQAETGLAFSVDAGRAYLTGLTGESLDEAVRYIQNAPETTMTPLRRALGADGWWMREAARVRGLAAGCES